MTIKRVFFFTIRAPFKGGDESLVKTVLATAGISINVPVVYMARYVMVLRQARSITRGIGRGGPWKSRLFWALKCLRAKRVPLVLKKSRQNTSYIAVLARFSYRYISKCN